MEEENSRVEKVVLLQIVDWKATLLVHRVSGVAVQFCRKGPSSFPLVPLEL